MPMFSTSSSSSGSSSYSTAVKNSESSSSGSGSVPFSSSSISFLISSDNIVFVSCGTEPSSLSFSTFFAFFFSISFLFFSIILAFSFWVSSQFDRISSILICPVICGSSCSSFAATSTPLATATPVFSTSARLAPVIVVAISDVFSIFVRGLGGCGLSSGRLSKSGSIISAIGSGRSGRSILPVTWTFSLIFWEILGSGAGRSFGFLNIGFFLTGADLPAFLWSYFSCCNGVSGLYFILSSIA